MISKDEARVMVQEYWVKEEGEIIDAETHEHDWGWEFRWKRTLRGKREDSMSTPLMRVLVERVTGAFKPVGSGGFTSALISLLLTRDRILAETESKLEDGE